VTVVPQVGFANDSLSEKLFMKSPAMNPVSPDPPVDYNHFPYASQPFPFTHPMHLGALAILYGHEPVPPNQCRLLEVGFRRGGNLLPLAVAYPDSTFVGIDIADKPFPEALRLQQDLALHNLTLKLENLLHVDVSWGAFDYIVAHGIYSWVSADVQQKLWDVCQELLSPQGLAVISFATRPAGGLSEMLRQYCRWQRPRTESTQELPARVRAWLLNLQQNLSASATGAAAVCKDLVALNLQQLDENYLVNDLCDDHHDVVSLAEVCRCAARSGLRYLGDADLERSAAALPFLAGPQTAEQEAARVDEEMRSDYWAGRQHRAAVFCRADAVPLQESLAQRLLRVELGTSARPITAHGQPEADHRVDWLSDTPVRFGTPEGRAEWISSPSIKQLLRGLSQAWPQTVPASVWRSQISSFESASGTEDALSTSPFVEECLQRLAQQLLVARFQPPPTTIAISEFPFANPLARLQARTQAEVTTYAHKVLAISDPLSRDLLTWLDGTASLAELQSRLALWQARMQGVTHAAQTSQQALQSRLKSFARHLLFQS